MFRKFSFRNIVGRSTLYLDFKNSINFNWVIANTTVSKYDMDTTFGPFGRFGTFWYLFRRQAYECGRQVVSKRQKKSKNVQNRMHVVFGDCRIRNHPL